MIESQPHDRPEEITMQVNVDADKCQGHNRCDSLAPELFDVDDLGTAFVIGDGVHDHPQLTPFDRPSDPPRTHL